MTMPLSPGASYLSTAGEGPVPMWTGTYAATVVNNDDPLGVGRLQLNIPQVLGNAVSGWAVPLGTYYNIPANGTTVSAAFIGGDPSQPTWIGPLDLAPVVIAGTTRVSYSATQPSSPAVGDIWYPISLLTTPPTVGPPQIWTFDSMTSTFSWVVQPSIGPPAIANLDADLVGHVGVLNPNPYYLGANGNDWAAINATSPSTPDGTFSVVTGGAMPAGAPYPYAGKITGIADSFGVMAEQTGTFNAVVNQPYQINAWVNCQNTQVAVGFVWSDMSIDVNFIGVTPNTWVQISTVITASVSGPAYPFLGSSSVGDDLYSQAVLVLPQVPGGLIQAGTVTAIQIAAGTITTTQLNANAIDGMTITGATLWTSSMVSNAMGQFYYSGNTNAPTVTPTGTGGTVAAGTYFTKLSYTNGSGESAAGNETAGIVTTGTTSKLTVTAPGPVGNATGYNVYMGTSTFGPWYRQNGGTPVPLASTYVQTTTPLASGPTAPTSVTGVVNVASKGNMVGSITASLSGTDSWGNPIIGGMTSYQLNWVGATQQALQNTGAVLNWYTSSTLGGAWVIGPEIEQDNNGNLNLLTNAGGTAGHVILGVGIGGGGNALALSPNASSPTAIAGSAVVFANTNGQQIVIDGLDGTTYNTQRRSTIVNTTSGSTSGTTLMSAGLSQAIAAKTYRFNGQLYITTTSTPQFGMQITTPTSTGQFAFTISRSTTFVAEVSGNLNTQIGATVALTGASTYLVTFSGVAAMTASGTFTVQVYNVTGTGSFTVNQWSYLDVMPV